MLVALGAENAVPRMLRSAPPLAAWCAADPGPGLRLLWSVVGPGSAEQRCTLHRVRDTGSAAGVFGFDTQADVFGERGRHRGDLLAVGGAGDRDAGLVEEGLDAAG